MSWGKEVKLCKGSDQEGQMLMRSSKMQRQAQSMNVTSGMPRGMFAKSVFIEAVRAKTGSCCQLAGHTSKEVEIVDVDQPVREVSCG